MTSTPVGFDALDDLARAACLLAVDPAGLGGLWLRGPADEAQELALQQLQAQMAPPSWRRLPAQIDETQLQGGIDLGLSLAAGRPVLQAGLLARAEGGVLLLSQAARAPQPLAARLAAALDAAGNRRGPCWCLLALDDSLGDDAPLAPALQRRLALVWRAPPPPAGAVAASAAAPNPLATALAPAWQDASPPVPHWPLDVAAARSRLRELPFDADAAEALCATAAAFGLQAPATAWQAWRAACVAAACAGRTAVAADDLALAARLVLAPRARCLPAPPQDAEPQDPAAPPEASPPPPSSDADAAPADAAPPPPPPPPPQAADAAAPTATDNPPPSDPPDHPTEPAAPLQDRLIDATQAAIPPGLLAQLAALAPGLRLAAGGGRRGEASQAGQRGRPLPSRRGPWRDGARLDLPATLRAALPWQVLRQRARESAGLPPAATRLLVRRDDLHLRRFRQTPGSTTVFVVDASGSQAMHRLAEAKGAVEGLLADCYVRRDRVALIAFRGSGAELLLAPTRSLVRARRSLAGLPGGGGTPLAAGIDAAGQLAQQVQRRDGERVVLVFLTDARANIARDGSPGRPQAMADALLAARAVRAGGWPGLLIDTSPRPQPAASSLALAMALRYVALPQGGVQAVAQAVSGAVSGLV